MRLSSTAVVVPPKTALSRHERFLKSACQACRADWGGLAIFVKDGLLRDHVTTGLTAEQTTTIHQAPVWIRHLLALANSGVQPGPPVLQPLSPEMPAVHSWIGLSWPIHGNAQAVMYVVRSRGELFGSAEQATLQALSELLAHESQQDESHLIAKLRVLNQVAQAAAHLRDLQQLFALTLLELERHIPWHCGAIWLRDDEQGADTVDGAVASRLVLARCSDRGDVLGLVKNRQLAVAESMFEPCVQASEAAYVDAAELAAARCALARQLAQGGASASFAVPLRAGQRLLGIMQCVCIRSGGFTNEQIQLFYLVADLLGPAIAQTLWLQQLEAANIELRSTQAQLIQSEKIRALGEMASGMAHDFNNALCGVIGFLELALLDRELSASCRAYLESSKTCALDAAQTVRRVQEFARQQRSAGDLQPLELDQLVRQTVELTRPKWESLTQLDNPIVTEVITEAGCLVRAIPAELREAMTNLIFNAVDAMPHGGKLTIQTWLNRGAACLMVQDTGVGISDDAKRRLFEPFFTTKGERGTGLGLSVTFGIVQRHGGHIAVDSTVGRGTTFTIHLPACIDAAPVADTDPEIQLPPTATQVLVVEDEEYIRHFLSVGLEGLGYQLQTAPSAEDALSVLSTRHFDVILTDLGLPGMSGAELAKTMQRQSPGTPVVLLTGWGEQIQAENQHIDGVAQILAKPVTISTLARTLATVCAL